MCCDAYSIESNSKKEIDGYFFVKIGEKATHLEISHFSNPMMYLLPQLLRNTKHATWDTCDSKYVN